MIRLLLIGDIHGKFQEYIQLLKIVEHDESIQLGDFGLGFRTIDGIPLRDKFIRGNHDEPKACRAHKNYLGDYGALTYPQTKVFYLSGAFSIDWQWRMEHNARHPEQQVWWADEELSNEDLEKAYIAYCAAKPDIMLSHECPSPVGARMLAKLQVRNEKLECQHSRTAKMLQKMFEYHQPKQWYFGHYHFPYVETSSDTSFICLPELGYKVINV